MDDVTVPEKVDVETQPVETPAAAPTNSGNETPVAPEAPQGTPPVVPEDLSKAENENLKKALHESREREKTARREAAELKSKTAQSKYNPDDYQQWQAHPYSQELLVKVAKQELTDYARETLRDERYSAIPSVVKKAIEKNVRGFVNETTTDVDTAKVDLLDYIEGILEEQIATDAASKPVAPAAQAFPIAAPNAAASEPTGTPKQIAEIMKKSVEELTDADDKILSDYLDTQEKKSKK